MLAYHPFRTRSKSSPTRPQQSVTTDSPLHPKLREHSGRTRPHELSNTLAPPLPPLPRPPSSQSSPLQKLHKRIKRPTSAGSLGESRELGLMLPQEASAHVSRKPSRLRKSRPSTSSGVPERHFPDAMTARFSLSNVQKPRGDLNQAHESQPRRSHLPPVCPVFFFFLLFTFCIAAVWYLRDAPHVQRLHCYLLAPS
jgi:hypothetical protein